MELIDIPDLPGRLNILAAGVYRYTEDQVELATGDGDGKIAIPDSPGFVEFVFHPNNGTVEVTTAGAPMVPWQLLMHVAVLARARSIR